MNIFFNIFCWCYVAFCICMIIYFLFALKRSKKREKEIDEMYEKLRTEYTSFLESLKINEHIPMQPFVNESEPITIPERCQKCEFRQMAGRARECFECPAWCCIK